MPIYFNPISPHTFGEGWENPNKDEQIGKQKSYAHW